MADVPAEVLYGGVSGYFTRMYADSADAGAVPDEVPLQGTVTLFPTVEVMRWPTTAPPRVAVISPVPCVLDGGVLKRAAEGGNPPVPIVVIASDQPDAVPNRVQWRAVFQLLGVTTQPADVLFDVYPGQVVDLADQVSASPQPGTVTIVSHADRLAAEDAAASAIAARDAAMQAALEAAQAAGGLSAFQIAVLNGFTGTEVEWLASLEGPAGPAGADGAQGPAGADGDPGPAGPRGPLAQLVIRYEDTSSWPTPVALPEGYLGRLYTSRYTADAPPPPGPGAFAGVLPDEWKRHPASTYVVPA